MGILGRFLVVEIKGKVVKENSREQMHSLDYLPFLGESLSVLYTHWSSVECVLLFHKDTAGTK